MAVRAAEGGRKRGAVGLLGDRLFGAFLYVLSKGAREGVQEVVVRTPTSGGHGAAPAEGRVSPLGAGQRVRASKQSSA